MRNVYFKMWIPIEYADGGNGNKTKVPDTGCWQKDFKNKGVFHQWASAYENHGENAGNYTIALVELPDGTMQEILPINIKFIN